MGALQKVQEEEGKLLDVHVIVEIYNLGNRGLLSAELFKREGIRVSTSSYSLTECSSPLLLKLIQLEPSSLFKIVVSLQYHGAILDSCVSYMSTTAADTVKTAFVPKKTATQKGLCRSESELRQAIPAYSPEILEGRKAKNLQEYLSCGYKHPLAHASEAREKRLKRTLVLSKAINLWADLEEDAQKAVLGSSWALGPLYVHDSHYSTMKKQI